MVAKIPIGKSKGTLKQESFCQEFMRNGGLLLEAYDFAYNNIKANRGCRLKDANRLLETKFCRVRIKELRTRLVSNSIVDRNFIATKLLGILNAAERTGENLETARKACMDLAKLHGLIVDRAEIGRAGEFKMMDNITIDGTKLTFDIGRNDMKVIEGDE